jgi:hypothetical protein
MEEEESARVSPLRLRIGVALILLWFLPFWALSPYIADSLSSLSNPPSVAEVTTFIVVVQTVLGILGFLVAGKEVKSIVKGTTKKLAFGNIWYMMIHGKVRGGPIAGADPHSGTMA